MQDQGLHKQHKPWKEWGTDLNVRQLRQMQTHTRVLRELCGKLDVLAEEAESTSPGSALWHAMKEKRTSVGMDRCRYNCLCEGAHAYFRFHMGYAGARLH